MNRLIRIVSLAVLLFAAAGCEKEEFARYASYGRIVCTPTAPKVGDTVTFKVEVLDAGNRIYHADYIWKINGEYYDEVRITVRDNAKTIKEIPTIKWVPTQEGTFNISMSAYFKYSMMDENGQMRSANSAKGSVKVRAK
jgi:signal peptidase I